MRRWFEVMIRDDFKKIDRCLVGKERMPERRPVSKANAEGGQFTPVTLSCHNHRILHHIRLHRNHRPLRRSCHRGRARSGGAEFG